MSPSRSQSATQKGARTSTSTATATAAATNATTGATTERETPEGNPEGNGVGNGQAPSTALAQPERLVRPLSLRAMFLRPERPGHLAPSPWLEHLPFAFWLAEAHQPRGFAELGSAPGTAYYGFCQAIERLSLPTEARAFGAWEDDGAWSETSAWHDGRYGGFSRLTRTPLAAATPAAFDPGLALDLLHIDGAAALEAVLPALPAWLDRLSERGVVLVRGCPPGTPGAGGEAMAALTAAHPHFNFVQGGGLTVVAPGPVQSEALRSLLEAEAHPLARRAVRETFERLGRAVADAQEAETARAHLAALQGGAATAQAEAERLRAALAEAEAKLSTRDQALAAAEATLTTERARADLMVQLREEARAELRERTEALIASPRLPAAAQPVPVPEPAPTQPLPVQPDPAASAAAEAEVARLASALSAAQADLDRLRRAHEANTAARAGELDTLRRASEAARAEKAAAEAAREDALRAAEHARLETAARTAERDDLVKRLRSVAGELEARWREIGQLVKFWRNANPDADAMRRSEDRLSEALRTIDEAPLFDPDWYAARYPDIEVSEIDPTEHYVRFGARLRRTPGPGFDTGYYCDKNADVGAGGHDALLHFAIHGQAEGRAWQPVPGAPSIAEAAALARPDTEIHPVALARPDDDGIADVRASGLFDGAFYLATNPDVRVARMDPLAHFCRHGWKEDRNPSPNFSMAFYRRTVAEAADPAVNPLLHYIHTGRAAGVATAPSTPPPRSAAHCAFLDDPAVGPDMAKPWQENSAILKALGQDPAKASDTLPEEVRTLASAALAENPLKVSVVVPTWNREATVAEAINSALAQTYPPSEILVVDDGSEDDSVAVIEKTFANEIARGQVVVIQNEHAGVSAARNAGLKAATGDLIAYLDSDNVWRPDFLLVMAGLFAESDEVMTAYAALQSHDKDTGRSVVRATPYDRQSLLHTNFIDLNVFVHRALVHKQSGLFDEALKRLVDWDFVLRATRFYPPAFVPHVGVDYYLDEKGLGNITRTVPLSKNRHYVLARHAMERIRHGLVPLRLAYVIWDFPARSQTFVMEELRWLVRHGQDVKVYFKIDPDRSADLDFPIDAHRVEDADELARLLVEHERTLIHCHFAYPGATLLAWPAARQTGLPFTVFAHAVDIFHHNNIPRNRIDEIVADPLCQRLFVHGDFHREFLESRGVPRHKIFFTFQACDLGVFEGVPALPPTREGPLQCAFVGRFVEKKGIDKLIEAAVRLKGEAVRFDVYGYGPLDEQVRARVAEAGLDNLTLHGALDGLDAVAEAIAAADCVVVPSVVAANGDTEGFPTVILEAMAAGRPVVASAISAVPNHLCNGIEAILTEPGDIEGLAEGIRTVAAMSPARRDAMLDAAKRFLASHIGTEATMAGYLDVWRDNRLDIFMVAYNTPKYEDSAETFEILDRLMSHTATPFTLTIVDNGSEPEFRAGLTAFAEAHDNVRLILKRANVLCGPASNAAMALGDANWALYVCSKEGFVTRHGWERALVRHTRAHPEQAMAGYLTHMPRFVLGRELLGHPEFEKFRNPEFAHDNPDHVFRHVQGGTFILSRRVVAEVGGFSKRLPQGGMDVEYSYFLESAGQKIGVIDGVYSLTTATLPRLDAVLDEHTAVAHPLTCESAEKLLDARADSRRAACNLGAHEQTDIDEGGVCSVSGSTAFGRTAYQRLAHDWRAHRKGLAVVLSPDKALAKTLGQRMFKVIHTGTKPSEALAAIEKVGGKLTLAVADPAHLPARTSETFWRDLRKALAPGGLLLFANDTAKPRGIDSLVPESRPAFSPSRRPSRTLRQDWRELREIAEPPS
ncbi:MAG: glycosyltransferase [Pseudomonadota bacterium]